MKLAQLHERVSQEDIMRWLKDNWGVDPGLQTKIDNHPASTWEWSVEGEVLKNDTEKSALFIHKGEISLVMPGGNNAYLYGYNVKNNPPFKFKKVTGGCLVLEKDWDDLKTLPSTSFNLIFNYCKLTSFRGISRVIKSVGRIDVSCKGKLTGITELAALKYTSKNRTFPEIDPTSCHDDKLKEALTMVCDHVKRDGSTKLLELRKQLIEAGYGEYA